jgi:hypothetical protein
VSEVATVPLALDDFVPVLLAGVGALLLAGAAPREQRPGARAGAALILAGGLCKAGWKLALAVTGHDEAWVADLLFVLLAPGFTLLAWGLLAARGRTLASGLPAGVVGVAGAVALLAHATWPLLVLTVVTSTATGVLALLVARDRGESLAMVLFGVQLVMAYALVPLAGTGQSISHQWWEQSLNTLGQGAFALAAARLVSVRSYA